MSVHLQREIERLKRMILALGATVEEGFHKSIRTIETGDAGRARDVIEKDGAVDREEVAVEEECLKILALHQPVAIDLRFIVSVLKINNDLERIGDLAANIAERALRLSRESSGAIPFDLAGMADKVGAMLKKSLDALVSLDPRAAREVCVSDDEIDAMNRAAYDRLRAAMRNDPSQVDRMILILSVSHHLERIADHATNIAEDVLYMLEGEIVRHAARKSGDMSRMTV
jgi:phosphate transport system protein